MVSGRAPSGYNNSGRWDFARGGGGGSRSRGGMLGGGFGGSNQRSFTPFPGQGRPGTGLAGGRGRNDRYRAHSQFRMPGGQGGQGGRGSQWRPMWGDAKFNRRHWAGRPGGRDIGGRSRLGGGGRGGSRARSGMEGHDSWMRGRRSGGGRGRRSGASISQMIPGNNSSGGMRGGMRGNMGRPGTGLAGGRGGQGGGGEGLTKRTPKRSFKESDFDGGGYRRASSAGGRRKGSGSTSARKVGSRRKSQRRPNRSGYSRNAGGHRYKTNRSRPGRSRTPKERRAYIARNRRAQAAARRRRANPKAARGGPQARPSHYKGDGQLKNYVPHKGRKNPFTSGSSGKAPSRGQGRMRNFGDMPSGGRVTDQMKKKYPGAIF